MKKIENPNTIPIVIDEIREQIRAVVDSYYDLQKIRIAYGNRIFAAFKDSAEQEEVDKLLKDIVSEYKLVADALVKNPNLRVATFIKKNDTLKYIKNKFYYDMLDSYNSVYEAENKAYQASKKLCISIGCGTHISRTCSGLAKFARHYVSRIWIFIKHGMCPLSGLMPDLAQE